MKEQRSDSHRAFDVCAALEFFVSFNSHSAHHELFYVTWTVNFYAKGREVGRHVFT